VPTLGATPTYNYLLQHQFLQTAIKPILGQHVVSQELVVLHKSGIVQELNDFLRDINHTRKDKFKGTFVGETDWGFLVEDMRPMGELPASESNLSRLFYFSQTDRQAKRSKHLCPRRVQA
jgi:inositol-pentakisphosphate 2-kinase